MPGWCGAGVAAAVATTEGVLDFFAKLVDTEDFPRRWHCGQWSEAHGWLHILSDFAICGAYMAIPLVMAAFLLSRRDLHFPPVLWLFVAFIGLCGLGHGIEGTIFWKPWYRLSGLMKLLTATASWATVVALVRITPSILALPAKARLSDSLQAEVSEHQRRRDDALSRNQQLEQLNEELRSFSELGVEREMRVLDLKKEINELCAQLGETPRYVTDFDDS